ncbi:hypothetical protein EMEDMD4_1080007 [Sinorhizobium medicae]|uniref:Uncharacterized protein n=1 Tax=Sinorhizobium medicae TaxID=110321 RepID=A0A508WUU9_9HYPH|nr:hypothetical protein EMEDMD4_1080007 [Sinorhizobium medicae]
MAVTPRLETRFSGISGRVMPKFGVLFGSYLSGETNASTLVVNVAILRHRSRFSRPSLHLSARSLVSPSREPLSISAFFTH